MNLYFLRFKDEPLFKLGVTARMGAARWAEHGPLERFNLNECSGAYRPKKLVWISTIFHACPSRRRQASSTPVFGGSEPSGEKIHSVRAKARSGLKARTRKRTIVRSPIASGRA